jgi:hypothetical protein
MYGGYQAYPARNPTITSGLRLDVQYYYLSAILCEQSAKECRRPRCCSLIVQLAGKEPSTMRVHAMHAFVLLSAWSREGGGGGSLAVVVAVMRPARRRGPWPLGVRAMAPHVLLFALLCLCLLGLYKKKNKKKKSSVDSLP